MNVTFNDIENLVREQAAQGKRLAAIGLPRSVFDKFADEFGAPHGVAKEFVFNLADGPLAIRVNTDLMDDEIEYYPR